MDDSDRITEGKYVILQRGDQQRVILFQSQQMILYGKGPAQQDIQLKNALNEEFYTAFKVLPLPDEVSTSTDDKKGKGKPKKTFYLEKSTEAAAKSFSQIFELPSTITSAKDNRNIFDDKSIRTQAMGQTDIFNMREQGVSSREILDTIISSSKSFTKKTEFSQEKYLKRKEKIYGDVLLFLKTDLHLVAEYYFKKDPSRILGLRPDTLSQILSYANIHAYGKYIVYENVCGLVVSAILQRLGGLGCLLHCHAGTNPQRQALNYMNLTEEVLTTLRNLDVFYLIQRQGVESTKNGKVEIAVGVTISENSETECVTVEADTQEPLSKRIKMEVKVEEDVHMTAEDEDNEKSSKLDNPPRPVDKLKSSTNRSENQKSLELLNATKFDGLVICGKEHPLSILQRLLPHVGLSCPFVVYCFSPEPLMDCYMWIKENGFGVNMQIVDNWFRNIQVDTERTHPEINMSASGGYLLYGMYVKDNPVC